MGRPAGLIPVICKCGGRQFVAPGTSRLCNLCRKYQVTAPKAKAKQGGK